MNNKTNLISIFNLAEKQTKGAFSLPEIGVKLPETEANQLIEHNDQILAAAEIILDEAA